MILESPVQCCPGTSCLRRLSCPVFLERVVLGVSWGTVVTLYCPGTSCRGLRGCWLLLGMLFLPGRIAESLPVLCGPGMLVGELGALFCCVECLETREQLLVLICMG